MSLIISGSWSVRRVLYFFGKKANFLFSLSEPWYFIFSVVHGNGLVLAIGLLRFLK